MISVGGRLSLAFALMSLLALGACSSTSDPGPDGGVAVAALSSVGGAGGDLRVVAELPAPPAVQGGVAQPIANADVLEVSVFQVENLSRTVQVDDQGFISLPLIGRVQAGGKSVQALQHDIESAYAKSYLQSPSVSVFLKESASRRVTVDGEAMRSGVFNLPPGASLLDAIALGGGFSPLADSRKVYVFRRIGETTYVSNYDVDAIRLGSRANPAIHGGDIIIVFSSQSRVALQNLKEALGVASSVGRLAVLTP